ncbi:hypothetical protein [Paenibacillus typhae]
MGETGVLNSGAEHNQTTGAQAVNPESSPINWAQGNWSTRVK